MNDLAKDHIYQLMESVKDLCDAVGNQSANAVKTRVTDIQTDLNNLDEPRVVEGGDGG
ncbi:MAG: hypothetical protein ACW99G_20420 [Candidatus Thorarchaeota archaeon]|jgi:hypothetical protein